MSLKKNAFFTKKLGTNWKEHGIKRKQTLKKPCVKFEERRLNTLQENRICQKVKPKH